jgi:NADPH:quinone reductase-like Zn-dependent oxidoreductase
MRAILRRRYGGPEVLTLETIDPPTPDDGQVLVRVHAASVNAYDWHLLRGKPYVARPSEGLFRPRDPAMGVDLAGVVEAVGAGVHGLAVGDRVFGGRTGAFREVVAARTVVRMPEDLSFEAAAAAPMAGLTALQGLRDKAGLRSGEHVLVAGAGGGVGTFAVQIARALGADRVTATTSGDKAELLRSLGADEVIDYRAVDPTRAVRDVDVVLDVGGHGRLSAWRRTLTPTGRIVLVGPGRGDWLGPINRVVTAAIGSRFQRQKALPFLSHTSPDDLAAMADLLGAGRVRSVIDRVYPLEDTPAAVAHVESGSVKGKVVIAVA